MLRKGSQADVQFMRAMLAHAYHWHVAGLDTEIPLARYVDHWGRPGDLAVIAADGPNPVGAAWCRRFTEAAPGYGFVDEETPELTIAVVPSKRKHGVGQELLDALLARAATEKIAALSLSVEKGSPAVAFYERNGFTEVAEHGKAVTMLRRLES
ncbi:MAG TPA: GNAT family N-acetyltransferase [Gaiellaceae bacterium]|nr:GNAT family N-acetyltransferase [Gaiellaceae bacterium]